MPTHPRVRRLGPGVALALLLLVGVPAVTAADRDVGIADFEYAPATVTVRVGDSVTWTNRDPVEHTATATNGSFDTGLLGSGDSATVRFTKAGRFDYLCTPHPFMTGTIIVRAAAGGSGSGTTTRPPDSSTLDAPETAPPGAGGATGWLALVGGLALIVADRIWRRRGAR